MKAVCIIPARGGSRRIPRKNIRNFHGKPIIAYSIEAAQRSGLFDQIIVSTEDPKIMEVAEWFGADVHERSDIDARDDVGTQEIGAIVLESLADPSDFACVIYATAPLLSVTDLCRGLDYLRHAVESDFAVSVGVSPLRDAGQFYWGYTEAFIDRVALYENARLVPIAVERVCDINTEADWQRAEHMYLALHRSGGASV